LMPTFGREVISSFVYGCLGEWMIVSVEPFSAS